MSVFKPLDKALTCLMIGYCLLVRRVRKNSPVCERNPKSNWCIGRWCGKLRLLCVFLIKNIDVVWLYAKQAVKWYRQTNPQQGTDKGRPGNRKNRHPCRFVFPDLINRERRYSGAFICCLGVGARREILLIGTPGPSRWNPEIHKMKRCVAVCISFQFQDKPYGYSYLSLLEKKSISVRSGMRNGHCVKRIVLDVP